MIDCLYSLASVLKLIDCERQRRALMDLLLIEQKHCWADTSFDYSWPKTKTKKRFGTGCTVIPTLQFQSLLRFRFSWSQVASTCPVLQKADLIQLICCLRSHADFAQRHHAVIFAWIIRGGAWDQNMAWTPQQGNAATRSANGPPELVTSYCCGYLHAEPWALSRAF